MDGEGMLDKEGMDGGDEDPQEGTTSILRTNGTYAATGAHLSSTILTGHLTMNIIIEAFLQMGAEGLTHLPPSCFVPPRTVPAQSVHPRPKSSTRPADGPHSFGNYLRLEFLFRQALLLLFWCGSKISNMAKKRGRYCIRGGRSERGG
jgi:hypothetical protein